MKNMLDISRLQVGNSPWVEYRDVKSRSSKQLRRNCEHHLIAMTLA